MIIDAMSHGAEAAAGMPVIGRKTRLTSAEPVTISVVVESGSRPTLISAFHPAWQSAADSTARKTTFSKGYAFAAAGAHILGPARRYCRGRAISAPSPLA